MENYIWIIYAVVSGLMIGAYQLLNKKSVSKTSPFIAVLLMSTSYFIFALWRFPEGLTVSMSALPVIALRGITTVSSWLLTLNAVKYINVSRAALIQNLSILVAIFGGLFIFGDTYAWWNYVGVICICSGIVLTSLNKCKSAEHHSKKPVIFAVIASLCSGCTGILDKTLFNVMGVTSGQMQFWVIAFIVLYLWCAFAIVCIVKKQCILKKDDFKNFWAYLAGFALFLADVFLFLAMPFGNLSTIKTLAQVCILVTFFGGIFIFKEKTTPLKFIFLLLVLFGIVLTVL